MTIGEIWRTCPSPVDDVLTCVAALVTSKVSVEAWATTSAPVKLLCENVGAVPPYSVENITEFPTDRPCAGEVNTPGLAKLTVAGIQLKFPRKSQANRFPLELAS